MRNNHGITLITLIITIIVIIIIASITIYSGIHTINSIRKRSAYDATNAIYLSLIENEDIIPIVHGDTNGFKLSEATSDVIGRQLYNDDFHLLNLDFTNEDCTVVFNRKISSTVENLIEYEFTYTDDLNHTYQDINYSYYFHPSVKTTEASFDKIKKVNRPVLNIEGMVAKTIDGTDVTDVYIDNWYDYGKGISHFATMEYNGDTYVWIPRFAYRAQTFYIGKTYQNVPTTAIDIIFLRDSANYMENGEPLSAGYLIHPAFENGGTGFWIMVDAINSTNSIDNAINGTNDVTDASDNVISHLMKNSEYAAAMLLSLFLDNEQIHFSGQEFVGAVCNSNIDHFDIYSTDSLATNYIQSIRGQALYDMPWNLKKDLVEPEGSKVFFVRNVAEGGKFYFEAVPQVTTALYRRVIFE